MIKSKYLVVRIVFILFFVLFSVTKFLGQTAILDSLKKHAGNGSNLNEQLQTVIEILSRSHSIPADTFYKYIKTGEELAIPNSPELYRVKAAYAGYLTRTGNIAGAFNLTDSLLSVIPSADKYFDSYLWLLNSRIGLNIRTSRSKEAIDNLFLLLKKAEQNNNEIWISRAYVNLGWAHMELEKFDDAIKWLNKGIDATPNEYIKTKSPFLFSNIASCYNNIGKSDSAFYFINEALRYGQIDQNLFHIANALNIRADIYVKQKKFAEAEADLNEAIKIREQIGDNLFIVSDLAQLSSFYASINKTDKGIDVALRAIPVAEKLGSYSKLIFLYGALAKNYKEAKMGMEYGEAMQKISQFKDSLNKKNSNEAITALEVKYELQKKENIIIQQESKITRNRYIAIGSIIIVVLISVLMGLAYRNRQLLQMQKMEAALVQQKMLAAEEIRTAQETERKRIAADLHDNLGAYAAAITNNVKGLKEKTVDENTATENLEENARKMVTQLSDTIWVLKNEQLLFTNLADRFKAWMQRLMKNYPAVKYDFSEKIVNDISFTPVNILHLFYILKECVNNALRHSGCTEIKIDFLSDDKLSITVADNGNGMKHHPLEGNGIDNIKKRAEVCGWKVEWKANKPQGTQIMLSATTK
ncbi:MAG TPA: tetratricopeptide repeat protein [Bacteroidia bacterium]|nr:tetratricopeptide repeat protein [Bacteroidia bacterium]HNU32354.1 tetratricopeptide repeat protein [Bacteroidia bacterium]